MYYIIISNNYVFKKMYVKISYKKQGVKKC